MRYDHPRSNFFYPSNETLIEGRHIVGLGLLSFEGLVEILDITDNMGPHDESRLVSM